MYDTHAFMTKLLTRESDSQILPILMERLRPFEVAGDSDAAVGYLCAIIYLMCRMQDRSLNAAMATCVKLLLICDPTRPIGEVLDSARLLINSNVHKGD